MLAGRMKLTHFVAIVIGVGGLYWACNNEKKSPPPQEQPAPHTVVEDHTSTPPAPPPVPDAAAAAAASTEDLAPRPYDAEVLGWQGRTINGGKQKDVSRGRPYKINVYQDAGKSTVNRVKVDANRNEKWDDKYTFDGAKITLERAPDDDERYTQKYHWTGSGWSKAE